MCFVRSRSYRGLEDNADRLHSSHIILGVYLIIFGAGEICCDASDKAYELTEPQALHCLSSRSLSKSLAMRLSCSPSSAVVSVSEPQSCHASWTDRLQSTSLLAP